MSEIKEEVVKKCIKCSQDLIVGQKFCAECGSRQDVPMRTRNEILEMRKLIFEVKPLDLRKMMVSLVMILLADTVLGWVLGNTSNRKLLDLIEGNKPKGGE